jgi:hypothetical protein
MTAIIALNSYPNMINYITSNQLFCLYDSNYEDIPLSKAAILTNKSFKEIKSQIKKWMIDRMKLNLPTIIEIFATRITLFDEDIENVCEKSISEDILIKINNDYSARVCNLVLYANFKLRIDYSDMPSLEHV